MSVMRSNRMGTMHVDACSRVQTGTERSVKAIDLRRL